MKTIITKKDNSTTIHIDDLPENPIIGIVDACNEKGWIQRVAFDYGKYMILSIRGGVCIANGWMVNNAEHASLKDVLAFARNPPKFQMFLFDSERELFKWLAE